MKTIKVTYYDGSHLVFDYSRKMLNDIIDINEMHTKGLVKSIEIY